MDNGAYSFLELRRNIQDARSSAPKPSLNTPNLGTLRPDGTTAAASTPVKISPPLRKLNPDAENRKPLFNLLYGSHDKPRAGNQVLSRTPQRKPLKQNGGSAECHFEDGRLSEGSQPRLDRYSSPLAPAVPPRSDTSTPFVTDGLDDTTRHFFNSYIALKAETNQLRDRMQGIQREYEEAAQDRDAARAEFEKLSAQLREMSAQATDLRRTVSSYEAKLSESQSKVEHADHSIGEAKETIESLTFQLKEEGRERGRICEKIQMLKRSLHGLQSSSEERASSYNELRDRHHALLSQLQGYGSLVGELRSSVSDAVEANKVLLQPDGFLTLLRGSKVVIGELQAQLESSKEVTNILRDKLHHLASVVAESKARIEELEAEKRTSLARLHEDYEDLKARSELSATLQKKVEDLTDRLVVRETETFDYLATAVTTEERLEAANAELGRLKASISESETELASLRALREDHLNKLMAVQEVANGRDRELSIARTELKSVHESKAELRALLLEAKKTIAEKDEELLKRDPNPELEFRIRELSVELEAAQGDLKKLKKSTEQANCDLNTATKAAEVAQVRCKELEKAAELQAQSLQEIKLVHKIALDVVTKEKVAAEEKFQSDYANLQSAAAKELAASRVLFDHQTSCLEEKLAIAGVELSSVRAHCEALKAQAEKADAMKEGLIGRHQEHVRQRDEQNRKQEVAHAAQVAALGDEIKALTESQISQSRDSMKQEVAVAGYKAAIRELQVENKTLAESLASIKQEQTQFLALVADEKERHAKELESQVNAQRKLVEAQEQRARSTQTALDISQRELQRNQAQVAELINRASLLKSENEELQLRAAQKDEHPRALCDTAEAQNLRAHVESLVAENAQLKDGALRLLDRYRAGNLTETEKSLVRHVVSVTESVHEEELIQKDHEIKSRDSQLHMMQQRNKGLEKTLAQVLRNQRVDPTSQMVNLQSVISSSPKEPPFVEAQKAPGNKPDFVQGGSLLVDPSKPGASSRIVHEGKASMAKLMESSDEEISLSNVSSLTTLSNLSETKKKRARMSSPPPPPPPVSVQTKRRTKNAPVTKRGAKAAAGSNADRKASEDVGRSRGLKRK